MKNKSINLLSILIPIISMVACSSGNSTPSSTSSTSIAPSGPIDYNLLKSAYGYQATPPKLNTNSVKLLTNNSGCGAITNEIDQIVSPVAILTGSMALGLVRYTLSLTGGKFSTSCLNSTLQNLSNQLNQQQQQIIQIESYLQLQNNEIYQLYLYAAQNQATTDQYLYNQAFIGMNGNGDGTSGIFSLFMNDIGFWSNGVPQDFNESQMATNLDVMNIASIFVLGNQNSAQNYLYNVTGAGYRNCQLGNCYTEVNQNNNSAYVLTLKALYQELLAQQSNYLNTSSESNIIPLYDSYNNNLSALYQQNVTVIAEAYQMEFSINELNALSNGTTQQIDSLFSVPGTHFSYDTSLTQSENTINYNIAQNQLNLYFAALVNQTYTTTLGYMVSDLAFGNQSYPTTPLTYTTTTGIESTFSGFTGYSAKISSMVESPVGYYSNLFAGTNYANNIMIYQYDGINNINQCLSSLDAQNSSSGPSSLGEVLNASNCSPIFWNQTTNSAYNQGTYTSNQFTPYSFSNQLITLYNSISVLNNLSGCSASGLASFTVTTNGQNSLYLQCNNNFTASPSQSGGAMAADAYDVTGVSMFMIGNNLRLVSTSNASCDNSSTSIQCWGSSKNDTTSSMVAAETLNPNTGAQIIMSGSITGGAYDGYASFNYGFTGSLLNQQGILCTTYNAPNNGYICYDTTNNSTYTITIDTSTGKDNNYGKVTIQNGSY